MKRGITLTINNDIQYVTRSVTDKFRVATGYDRRRTYCTRTMTCKQTYDRGPLGTLSLHDKHHALLGRLENARILPVHHKHSVPTRGWAPPPVA